MTYSIHSSTTRFQTKTMKQSAWTNYLSTPLAIDKASLPEEYVSRDKEFKELSTLLISEINNLHEMGAKPDEEMFEAKFEEMHETFETLAHKLM